MLTEQSAYTNRWRRVHPAAKGLFSLCGMIAAFTAGSPTAAFLITTIIAAITIIGAGVPFRCYLRVAAPALVFLATSALTLLISFAPASSTSHLSFRLDLSEFAHIAQTCGRSLACLAALLFLTMTTPLPDIISMLRKCRVPDTLLDLMYLCYNTLFVFSEAVHSTITGQSARLGYATSALSIRSLGCLIANLTVQVWQRSLALHQAALARNNDGTLRFLESGHPDASRNLSIAVTAGIAMITMSALLR